MTRICLLLSCLALPAFAADIPQILPPKPVAPLSEAQEAAITLRLDELDRAFGAVKGHALSADAAIFLKAVRYALEFDEWYDKKAEDGVKKVKTLLDEAESRIASLKKNETPWMKAAGWKVLGFYSEIDGSPQPYAVEMPEGLKWGEKEKPVPMWIWLHGRGDTSTDLHFIAGKLNGKKPGQFQPAGTIVIHPFGRYCNGWKSAGETDVFEARDDAKKRFNVDENRIALAGFSMGGAGAWHIGAHFADQWACVHAGAGFVDVKRYQKIAPDQMPPWYEEKLWRVYDVPVAARNFFNVPLVAYSGEEDKQRDGAEYMEETLAKEGFTLRHHIGPGMGHKYHPEVIKEVQAEIEAAVAKGRDPMPTKVVLQTRSLLYNRMFWVTLVSQETPWEDTRVEAEAGDDGVLTVTTKNVDAVDLHPPGDPTVIEIDGQRLEGSGFYARKDTAGQWSLVSDIMTKKEATWQKRHGQSGPIEESLKRPFLVVLPEAPCESPKVDEWVQAESRHFLERWRSLMRGDVQVKRAGDVTNGDMQRFTLVLWGDAKSNPLIAKILGATSTQKLPFSWSKEALVLGSTKVDGRTHVPVMVRPNPLEPRGTIILNSGLTFREAHDRTNSLQNPKLPDWAILDITGSPDGERAGEVVAADFFDENWQMKTN